MDNGEERVGMELIFEYHKWEMTQIYRRSKSVRMRPRERMWNE